jgi:DNA-binding NarL/FixJ family response regulator
VYIFRVEFRYSHPMISSFIREQEVLVTRIRGLLADDHEDFLRKLCGELDPEFEIVGTAENGEDAIDAARRLDPDILVIDMVMPVMDGIQATARLRDANCRTKIIFLTIHEQSDYVSAAFAAGASGYVTKRHVGSDLVPAIREVSRGGILLSLPRYIDRALRESPAICRIRASLEAHIYPLSFLGFLATPVASDSCAARGTIHNAD